MMQPECPNFVFTGRPDGGGCQIQYRGRKRPSYLTCDGCEHNQARGQMLAALKAGGLIQFTAQSRPAITAEEVAEAKAKRIVRLRQAWNGIHAAALAGQLATKIDGIIKGLPCGTCQDHFKSLRAEPIPPDAAEQFPLSVGWHNVVNAELGKPLMTVDEANKLYALAL